MVFTIFSYVSGQSPYNIYYPGPGVLSACLFTSLVQFVTYFGTVYPLWFLTLDILVKWLNVLLYYPGPGEQVSMKCLKNLSLSFT